MSRNSLIIFLLLLFSCEHRNKCDIAIGNLNDYKILYPSYSVDTLCLNRQSSLTERKKIHISFSNTWNDNVIVTKNQKVVFCDSIVSDKASAITNKGFIVKQDANSNNNDSISVYLPERKIMFTIKFSYLYEYIKLYKIADDVLQEYPMKDPIRVKATNCYKPAY